MNEGRARGLLRARRLLRPLCAVPLRADDRHLHPVVPGADRRPDLPARRRVAALVPAPVGGQRHCRHHRRVPALARARDRRDGPDGRPFAQRRSRLPQALPRRQPAVLRRHRQPDRALDRHFARHRARVPHARRLPQGARARLDRRRPDDDDGHVHLRARRASDLDAAVRPAGHVRDLQPLRLALRGGGARSRRDAVADVAPRRAADRPAVG